MPTEPVLHLEAPTWAGLLEGFELFREAILCGVVAGGVLGFLGVYIVLRRMVFVSAAMTQAAGLGVALAFYAEIHLGLHFDPVLGAAVLSLLATLLFSVDPQRLRVTRESLLGLAFALAGGAAVLVGDRIAQEAHDINSILFGTAVVVRALDLYLVLGVGGVVLLLNLWWFRGLTFASFDAPTALVQGLPVRLLSSIVFISIGAMVGVTARALGALPVLAFSILPATAALALGVRIHYTFGIALGLGAVAGGAGYLFAYFYQFPVGGSQTVVASAFIPIVLLGRILLRRRG